MECEKCIHISKPLFGDSHCTKFKNYNIVTKKIMPVKLTLGQKWCKGYFFEHKDSVLYSKKDASLSGEKNPYDY